MSDRPKADHDDIKLEVQGTTGIVTFDRPQSRNALTFQMYDRLAEICSGISSEGEIRSLVVTGAGGRAFAAGTDISQFQDFGSVEKALGYERRMEEVLVAIERCRVPTIAAVAGICTGGGVAIALACGHPACRA